MYGTTIGDQFVISGRSSQGYFENLIFHILARIGVIQWDQTIPEAEVCTDFVWFGVLGFQIRIINLVVWDIWADWSDRILYRSTWWESAAVNRCSIVRRIIGTCLTYFCIRSTDFTISQNIVLQCFQFGKNETEWNWRISEWTVVAWHRRNNIIADSCIQIPHVTVC